MPSLTISLEGGGSWGFLVHLGKEWFEGTNWSAEVVAQYRVVSIEDQFSPPLWPRTANVLDTISRIIPIFQGLNKIQKQVHATLVRRSRCGVGMIDNRIFQFSSKSASVGAPKTNPASTKGQSPSETGLDDAMTPLTSISLS